MLLIDPRNPRAADLAAALKPHLDARDLPADLRVVVGGDGWMLSCIRGHGAEGVYLGLNAGKLGFLLNDVANAAAVADCIREGRYREHGFPRLHMRMTSPDGERVEALAVNDIYVERMSGQTAQLVVRIDGVEVVSEMVCDGLLASTALGSTAYSFSAGGVPCHPMVRGIHITPICPHSPRLSPFMLPSSCVVEVEVRHPHRRPARAVSDGVEHGPLQRLEVSTAAEEVRLAFLEGHNFTETLIRKVLKS